MHVEIVVFEAHCSFSKVVHTEGESLLTGKHSLDIVMFKGNRTSDMYPPRREMSRFTRLENFCLWA